MPLESQPQGRETARRLAVGYAALAGAVLGLMVLGALVRAHGAGLACPDWPLCFGEFVPRMDLKVAFEWSHRVAAGGVSLVFAALAVASLRSPAVAAETRGLLALAALLLGVQILLGALTVWKLLAVWSVTSHLLTANAFAVTLALVALRLRDLARPDRAWPRIAAGARALLVATAVLLGLQVALGGLVSSSFAGMACPEWPACLNGEWYPHLGGNVALHLVHRTNGYLLLVALAASALVARRAPGVGGPCALALALGLAQVVVGVANVVLGLPVEVTGLHSALAAGLVLTWTVAVRQAWARPAL